MPKQPTNIKRPWIAEKPKHARSVDNSKFYGSWPWKKKRKAFRESNPLCVQCDESGRVSATEIVDHIMPISEGGAPLDDGNLQALCRVCHEKKSASESAKKRGDRGLKHYKPKRYPSHDSQNFTRNKNLRGGYGND